MMRVVLIIFFWLLSILIFGQGHKEKTIGKKDINKVLSSWNYSNPSKYFHVIYSPEDSASVLYVWNSDFSGDESNADIFYQLTRTYKYQEFTVKSYSPKEDRKKFWSPVSTAEIPKVFYNDPNASLIVYYVFGKRSSFKFEETIQLAPHDLIEPSDIER